MCKEADPCDKDRGAALRQRGAPARRAERRRAPRRAPPDIDANSGVCSACCEMVADAAAVAAADVGNDAARAPRCAARARPRCACFRSAVSCPRTRPGDGARAARARADERAIRNVDQRVISVWRKIYEFLTTPGRARKTAS
jgi:hypothetical protein